MSTGADGAASEMDALQTLCHCSEDIVVRTAKNTSIEMAFLEQP